MAVRFLLDEDTERKLAVILEREGFGVERVVSCETLGPGSSDDEVRAFARETDAVVLTHDADFVDGRHRRTPPTVFYAPNQAVGANRLARITITVVEAFPDAESLPPTVFLTRRWLEE